MNERKKIAVIVAGGSGSRMQSVVPKQFLQIMDKPVLYYSIKAFASAYPGMEILLVLPENKFSYGPVFLRMFQGEAKIRLVKGGNTRFASVKNALALIKEPAVVFVHDGVRPLISESLIRNCYEQALDKGSAVPAIALNNSIRRVEGKQNFSVHRDSFRIIQTPQTFLSELLLPAFEQAFEAAFTDEASVVEKSGKPVFLISGEENNIKLTRPIDMLLAEQLLKKRIGAIQ